LENPAGLTNAENPAGQRGKIRNPNQSEAEITEGKSAIRNPKSEIRHPKSLPLPP
jgi:hypothetical protein